MSGKDAPLRLCDATQELCGQSGSGPGDTGVMSITLMDGSIVPLSQEKGKSFREELGSLSGGTEM